MRLQEGSAGDLGAWMGSQVLEARCPFPHNAAKGLGAAGGLWDAQLGWKWELPALKEKENLCTGSLGNEIIQNGHRFHLGKHWDTLGMLIL